MNFKKVVITSFIFLILVKWNVNQLIKLFSLGSEVSIDITEKLKVPD